MATIAVIAKKSKVSATTVSRVFNRHPYVSENIRQRVLSAAEKLGYKPGFTSNRNVIAVIVEGIKKISISYYERILLTYISSHINENGYRLEIIPLNNLEMLRETFVPAAIAILFNEESHELLKKNCKIPVVTVNARINNFSAICSDHAGGIRMAVKYLFEKGHKRIALVQSGNNGWGGNQRLRGYKTAIKNLKLADDESLQETLRDSSWFQIIRNLYDRKATAIIICGEDQALPAVHAMNLLGIRIPDDMSVISFENSSVSPFMYPEHTTIAQDFEEIGRQAVKTAIENMICISKNNITFVDNNLIERDSVKIINS